VDERLIDQAATPGVSALTIAGSGGPKHFDLTSSKGRNFSERLIGAVLFLCAALSVLTTVGIVFILFEQALEFFLDRSLIAFLTGREWTALFQDPKFGVLPLVNATLLISAIAMLVALPLGLMSAIYLSEYAPSWVRSTLKPILEILAGIPTIVYGYFALTFVTPSLLQPLIPGTKVFNALAAGIAVGIMILPMVASLSEDAMRAVPLSLRQAGYALGATKLEVSGRIIMPAALSGIFASFILAASRAVGETMIVALASGSRVQLTGDPREPMQAMTGYIVQVVSGDVSVGSERFQSLFAVGALLFVLTLGMNIISHLLLGRFRQVYQ
jgi:phosphate transport system permease protein